MTLQEYIEQSDITKLAESLEVDVSTVYRWAQLKSIPTDKTKARIVELTHGLVTFESIMGPYLNR